MTFANGMRFGPYEILSPLGAGGMGQVYRARDTRLGRDVALKTLPDSFTDDPERLARFRREAQVLASLNHPHVGAIYGLEDVDGRQVLVLEFVDGETLADRLARGAIPAADAVVLARQIAEALEAAHDKGIVHRDLKPANIALTREGTVKVLDFGLAKAAEPSSGPHIDAPTLTSPALMTGEGVILGTAAYMSPEQARGRAADRRSDVWAFGCVLYEMLAGRRPFAGNEISDTIASVLRDEPDYQALPPAARPLAGLLRRLLEKDPARRLRDMSDVKLLITDADAAPLPLAPAGSRSRWIGAGAVAGIVAGVADRGAPAAVVAHAAAGAARRTVRSGIGIGAADDRACRAERRHLPRRIACRVHDRGVARLPHCRAADRPHRGDGARRHRSRQRAVLFTRRPADRLRDPQRPPPRPGGRRRQRQRSVASRSSSAARAGRQTIRSCLRRRADSGCSASLPPAANLH